MRPLERVKLDRLMERSSGRSDVVIGLIDGPVAAHHEDLVSNHRSRYTNSCCRKRGTRFDNDQPKLARNCKYLISNMAINPVQICVCSAFSEVPTKVFSRRFCLSALKTALS